MNTANYLIPFTAVDSGQKYFRIEDDMGLIFTYLSISSSEKAQKVAEALTNQWIRDLELPPLPDTGHEWNYYYPNPPHRNYPLLEGDPYIMVAYREGEDYVVSDEVRPASYFHNDGKEGNEFIENNIYAYCWVQDNPDAQDSNGDPL